MLQALYGGDSSPEVDTISTPASSDDMFLLEELDEAIEAGVLEARQTPYFADTHHQQGSLNDIIRGDYESTASASLQMGQMTSRTHDGILIHVKEANKDNILSYLSPVSASATEMHFLGQEKVARFTLFPHSFPPTKTTLMTPQLPVSPIKVSPLRTLSLSLPPITPLDTIHPSLLLPTPSRLASLPCLTPILPPIPSKPSPLPSLPSHPHHAPLSQTSHLEPLPSIPSKLPPLPSLPDSQISPELEALISTPCPYWYHLLPMDPCIRAGRKNRVAPLPPIGSQASQHVENIEEAKKELPVVDGEAEEADSSLKEVAEEGEKKKRKSLRKRFLNFIRRFNCFCCK
ncbi:max-binding protein MNT-like [Engraulis encrasicolus]|uniref:max-binding protein MNT-like n=1 Tax=Engraulis encrasicolus TaxID=184585 RepID=UPI002FD1B34D